MKGSEQLGLVRPYQGPMSYVMRFVRAGIALAIVSALGWLGGCSDSPGPDCCDPLPQGLVVSDPSPVTSLAAVTGALAIASGPGDSVVYVSLPPGTVPTGSRAIVRRVGEAASLTTSVLGGGFDPVPVAAQAGDSIRVVVTDAGDGTVFDQRVVVAAARPPIVVRTDPPRKKTDVPLNVSIVIVFSEPVDGSTLTTTSVRLLRGGSQAPGTVSLLQGSAAAAVFVPDAPLDANADYQLVVTQGVKDLGGDALAAGVTAEFTTGTTTVSPAYSVSVVPDTTAVVIGSQVQLIAAPRDTNGAPLAGRPVTWFSESPAVATVSPTGLVSTLAAGEAHIRAEVDFGVGVGVVLVTATLAPVNSVEVAPQSATVPVTGPVQLTAVLRDAVGNVLPFRPVNWATDNPGVATVVAGSGGTAQVTGVSPGAATITATSEGKSATAAITVVSQGAYSEIDAGNSHTCAVTTDSWAFCWGSGGLGNVPGGVAGGQRYSHVSAYFRTCALTPAGAAYCWGGNSDGGLGNGTFGEGSPIPGAVVGGHQFVAIGVGQHHTCALTTSGAAYCWGSNVDGLLGIGTTTGPEDCSPGGGYHCSTAPVAVAGGLTFTALTVGDEHTCALTVGGVAYCWGYNYLGSLGDSSTTHRSSPVPVAGGLTFVALSAGYYYTCGLTSGGIAYCWGWNAWGQLGTGTWTGPESCQPPWEWGPACSTAPVPVASALQWTAISAGGQSPHTCALTPSGSAYCWGTNFYGELGTGSATGPEQCEFSEPCSTTPVAVVGGLAFASVNAGAWHTCGVTVASIAYCWGAGFEGQLGNGSTSDSYVPVKVAGQR